MAAVSADDIARAGRDAWPTLRPDPPVAEVLRRKPDGARDPVEIFVAAALLAGDPAAPAAFEARYFDIVDAALARAGASADEIDEIRQLLRTRLLMPDPGGELRLVDYCGHGRLPGLLRVSAVRALINARAKRDGHAEHDSSLAERVAAEIDPGRIALARQERADVADATRAAALALDPRSRAVLRLSLVERLSIDEIGRVFGIHRATAARQLARARDALIDGVRERLAERWEAGAEALTLVSTHLELTLGRLLRTASIE